MGGTCLSIPAKQGCSSSQRDVPRTPGALSPVRTDAMEELSKVTKISPNCRPTFKNDSGILVLQCRVYLDDHVPTRGPWRLTAGTTQRGQRGARWILSSAPSPRSWGQTPGRAGVQPGREAAFLTHRYLPHRILTIGHITGPPYK